MSSRDTGRLVALVSEAARSASRPDGVAYTERQLYYEACRLLRPPDPAAGFPHTAPAALAVDEFREALLDLTAEHGPPAGLLAGPVREPLPLEGREADLAAYGLPRLLVCEDAGIARMLVANAFHMELSCAVVALAGAEPLPWQVRTMLARTRRARAYFLHDAGPEGLAACDDLERRIHLPRGVTLSAVGLTPAHAMRLRLVAARAPRRAATSPQAPLTPAERAWLDDGWSAEVTSVPPARLLRALRRIMLGIAPPPAPAPPARDTGFMTLP